MSLILSKVRRQCYSNRPGNFGKLSNSKEVQSQYDKRHNGTCSIFHSSQFFSFA